ncbi:MinD/ParA family ATP-binding protein [Gordonia humi]|uniref:MinD-like ATPase involved in chromosome partitioning or flagellar assembly n=1 Tax=Gordonia humi TaxID=686429 RepID=A0A840FC08_9ACTN|nr:MinD/ParA family protein [Gordonia humi]MBB4137650.1 MinD-like ATPase involved in chromosome partitioning or flagellar assembly [Gordonia humi]
MTTDFASPTGSGTGPYDPETPPWLVSATPPEPAAAPVAADPTPIPAGAVDLSQIVPPPPVGVVSPPVTPPRPAPPPPMPPPGGPRPNFPNPIRPTPPPTTGQLGPALDEVALIRKARRAPAHGWRRAVHTLSAGTVNPGESPAELEYRDLLDRVRQPVRGDYRIAVLSLKGGVGKTTTTIGLGSTFSSLRGDRVIAVDANPDLGTLAQRIPLQTQSTVRDLLADPVLSRYSDVRAHTSQAPSRLEVLASERDPAAAEAFDESEYRGVMSILQRFYNIILTDCGTGMSHDAMRGVLDLADAIVLVSSPALDGARSAGATLDWLQGHGFGHLIGRCVVVLSSARPGASSIDVGNLTQHFLTRCRAVQEVPFDDHLAEGADIDLDLLGRHARRAFVELAATIADDFGGTVLRRHPPFEG